MVKKADGVNNVQPTQPGLVKPLTEQEKMQAYVNSCTEKAAKATPAEKKKMEQNAQAYVKKSIKEINTPKNTSAWTEVKKAGYEWKEGFTNDCKKYGVLTDAMISHRIGGFTEEIDNESKSLDSKTVDHIKAPIKNLSKKIDKALDDGKSDGKLSASETAWNGVKAVGNLADGVLSTKGILTVGGIVATGGATAAGIVGGSFGVVQTGNGLYETATAKTDEQARHGIQSTVEGATMFAGSAALVKKVNVKGLKTSEAIVEETPVPKTAIKFESKPNTPERYVNTREEISVAKTLNEEGFSLKKVNGALKATKSTGKQETIVKYVNPSDGTPYKIERQSQNLFSVATKDKQGNVIHTLNDNYRNQVIEYSGWDMEGTKIIGEPKIKITNKLGEVRNLDKIDIERGINFVRKYPGSSPSQDYQAVKFLESPVHAICSSSPYRMSTIIPEDILFIANRLHN